MKEQQGGINIPQSKVMEILGEETVKARVAQEQVVQLIDRINELKKQLAEKSSGNQADSSK